MSQSSKVTQQIEAIIRALSTLELGASIEEIKAASGLDIELRTLQRRLADLKKSGFVKTSGDKRSTRYYYALPRIEHSGSDVEKTTQSEGTSLLPLSEEGQEIRSLVLLPELRRKPVGYNREFLENYQPNIDSYLTRGEKLKLADIGKTMADVLKK